MHFKNPNVILALVLLILVPLFSFAQHAESFYQQSVQTNQNAMWILGTWAAGNMVIGGVQMNRTDGSTRYLHQMNLMWNSVNMGIAVYALLSGPPPFTEIVDVLLSQHHKTEKLYIINSGLDLLYIGTGGYLLHRSVKSANKGDLLKGYGQSLMLQGGFLLLFDTALWAIQRNTRLQFLDQIAVTVSPEISGLGIAFQF